MTSFNRDVIAQWRSCNAVSRLVLVFLLLSQLPFINLLSNRLFLNFDLDRTPYEHMAQIERVRVGKSVYAPTSAEHQSISYTPLYWWVSGGICKILGPSFIWPRLVSLASSIVLIGLLFTWVWRRTEHNLVLSVAAPCFVTTTNYFIGPWMIDINVNALHVALSVLGFFLLTRGSAIPNVLLAAMVMSLSFLTKQTALAYVVAGGFLLLLQSRRMGLLYSLLTVVMLSAVCTWLNVSSDGDFYNVNMAGPKSMPWILSRVWDEVLSKQVFGLYGLLLAFSFVPILLAKKEEMWRQFLEPEFVMCAAGVAVGCIAQPKIGSGSLHCLVAYCGLAVCGCIGIQFFIKRLSVNNVQRLVAWLVTLEICILLVPAVSVYPTFLADGFDHQKYKQISDIFQRGRTCMYQFPYMPRVFGQPCAGFLGTELTVWSKGRMDYARKDESLNEPFRHQEYDYVILGVFTNPSDPNTVYPDYADPSVRAMLESYTMIGKLPAHPRWPQGGSIRMTHIVLKAKRLLSASSAPQGVGGVPKQ